MIPVDVVVPVINNASAARRCIDSVRASSNHRSFELVVAVDAAQDSELATYLQRLREQGAVTLVDLSSSEGYAAAANRAFDLHHDRDVVVLNAEALVAGDWLDRLAQHASERNVGVVATFTNRSGSATYPLPRGDNALPPGQTVATLDGVFARANAGLAVALPAVRGPCLYFRRDCLSAIGDFDASSLGGDFGVEVDFCMRAQSAGFRNLLAADVFVGREAQSAAASRDADEMSQSAELTLGKLYPAYAAQNAQLSQRDSLRPSARRVDLLRLVDTQAPILVFISHPWGGGIPRHMSDLAALVADRCEVLYLEPAAGSTVKLHWPRAGEGFSAYFTLPDDLPALAQVLRDIGVARLHFHHVHLLPRAVLDLPSAVGVPYDCTLHDYYAICPQYHLVTADGKYCGEPDAAGCAACLALRPGQWGLDIAQWRGLFGRLLRGAERVIAPSQDVATRIHRYFADLAVDVWSHPEVEPTLPPRIARVAVLGNLSPEKGLNVVAACAREARKQDLPLMFRLLGSTTEPIPQFPDVPLTIHGQYLDADLPRIIAAERPDVIMFPAQVPETYAYTLSVALASGLPIVASSLGAFPERMEGHPDSANVPWNAPPHVWNSALLAAAGMPAKKSTADLLPPVEVSP